MQWIPSAGKEYLKLNPEIKYAEPHYEFCEYLEGEYSEADIKNGLELLKESTQ